MTELRFSSVASDVIHNGLTELVLDINNKNPGSFFSKQLADCASNSTRSSGHNGNLVLDSVHRLIHFTFFFPVCDVGKPAGLRQRLIGFCTSLARIRPIPLQVPALALLPRTPFPREGDFDITRGSVVQWSH